MRITTIRYVLLSILVILAAMSSGFCYAMYQTKMNVAIDEELAAARDEFEVAQESERLSILTVADQTTEIEEEPITVTFTVLKTSADLYRVNPETREARFYKSVPGGTKLEVIYEMDDYYFCRYGEYEGLFSIDKGDAAEGKWYVKAENAVDLTYVLPNAEFDILFASDRNITGHVMYPAIPMLEVQTATMIAKANKIFNQDGYAIKIYDSYRPKSAQFQLYDIVQDSRYIANPYENNSFHQVGRAVDMSLIDMETGMELEMPTRMHAFNDSAQRYNASAWTEEARKNVDYMTKVMELCGFRTIVTEWWHYEFGETGNYMDPWLDYETLEYIPEYEYDAIFAGIFVN